MAVAQSEEKMLLPLVILVVCASQVVSLTDFEKQYKRTLSSMVKNPECAVPWCDNSTSSNGMITYVKADGSVDTIHHLFGTVGAPTLMMSRTPKGSKMLVNYDDLISGNGQAVNFTKAPDHSFGIIFSRIFEYDDVNDSANLSDYKNDLSKFQVHNISGLAWTFMDTSKGDYREVILNATVAPGTNSSLLDNNGYLSFTVRYDSKDGRLDTRPHMEFTANSSIITIMMSKFKTNFTHSRFAIEMVMFSTDNEAQTDDATQVSLNDSLDDEFSPGVFQMRDWEANTQKPRASAWGYAQWKPVVYTNEKRRNADLSHASSYPNLPKNLNYLRNQSLPARSLFHSYFGSDLSQVSMNATNVSFGQTNDKFYANTEYLVWTMAVGLGPPPSDDVSTLVILVIAIGLGIPLILMIFSVIFVCVKNYKKRKAAAGYEAINS